MRNLVMSSRLVIKGRAANGVRIGGGNSARTGVGSVLAQMVYQASPANPVVLIVASALLSAAALLACFVPARATRVKSHDRATDGVITRA